MSIIKENRIVSDHTFAVRFVSFLKDIQVNCHMGNEELDYMRTVANGLLLHQIKTATDPNEVKYLKSLGHSLSEVFSITDKEKSSLSKEEHQLFASGRDVYQFVLDIETKSNGKYYPIIVSSDEHKRLLAIQTKPSFKYFIKDKEYELEDFVKIIQNINVCDNGKQI